MASQLLLALTTDLILNAYGQDLSNLYTLESHQLKDKLGDTVFPC